MTRLTNLCAVSAVLALFFTGTARGQQAPTLSDFVLFGSDTLRARGLSVTSGDVGTNGTLVGSKAIDAPDSTIVGNRVELDKKSVCDDLRANSAESSAQCGPATPVAIPVVANLRSACGFPSNFPSGCSGPNLKVGHDGTQNATPGTYNVVDVAGGGRGPGTLILAPGTYNFCSLRLGRNASLLASGPVTINIVNSVKIDNGSQVRPDSGALSACDIKIFASTSGKVRISRKAGVQATLCAPNGKLDVTQGANLRGAFYAREVKTDRVFLELQVCTAPTTTSTTTTPTTTSTTSTTGSSCGNAFLDPGEQCDGSAEGSFCTPAECVNCQCPTTTTTTVQQPTTTSSSTVVPTTFPVTSSTTSTSTSSSTSTSLNNCGNNVIDPGEQCDGSAGGAFCTPAECVNCQCPTTTSTTVEQPSTSSSSTQPQASTTQAPSTTTTTSTATTSSTIGSSTTTSSTTISTTTSSSTSAPVPTTVPTTSSSSTSTSSSTSSSLAPTTLAPTTSTTSTSTSTSTTSTTGGTIVPTGLDFQSTAGSGTCGNTFRDVAGTIPLKNLLCGSLSLGGGISQVPDNATPPGATNRFTLTCNGTQCNLGTTAAGSTPAGIDCTAPGCRFGTPLPISNAGLSVCVTNTFFSNASCVGAAQPFACCTGAGTGTCTGPSGTLDTATGAGSWSFPLNSATVLTGNPTQPCPICAQTVGGAACSGSPASPCTGVCDGSPNQGSACTSTNPNGLSSDCPAPAAVAGAGGQKCFRGTNNNNTCSVSGDCPGGQCAGFIGNIPIALSPLTTGSASKTGTFDNSQCTGAGTPQACCTAAGAGACNVFCPGQTATQKGAFGSNICLGGTNNGKPCTSLADCPGGTQCRSGGTLNNYCVGGANDGLGCSNTTNCPAPGVCVKAGTLAQVVRMDGQAAGALTIGVPKPIKLGSVFCVPATSAPTVNANANLPAAGATSVTGVVTLLAN